MQAFGESYRIAGKVIFVHGLALSGAYAPALPKGEALAGRKVSAKRYTFINTMKKTTVVKNFRMLETARKLRREMTPQETKLWYRFLRSYPVKIYKQRIIESFIVDFYCADARLVIEIDGSQHYTEQGKCYDEERSQILRAYGLKVLRFSNRDVDRSFDSVCAQIHNIIQERCALPADDDD